MKIEKVFKVVLFISGVLLVIPGLGMLFNPIGFSEGHGIIMGENISALNDVRGTGGLLLTSGSLILVGVFKPSLTNTSTIVSVLVLVSLGLGRVISIAIDGIPDETLIKATIVEIVVGLIVGILGYLTYRKK